MGHLSFFMGVHTIQQELILLLSNGQKLQMFLKRRAIHLFLMLHTRCELKQKKKKEKEKEESEYTMNFEIDFLDKQC